MMKTLPALLVALLTAAAGQLAADDFVAAAAKTTPSVVTVISETTRNNRPVFYVTSGVIISGDGFVLTARQAVAGFDSISVRLNDGTEHAAALHGADALSGLALLRIEAEGLVAAEFGDSSALQVGQWVLAVGNQFGVETNATPGFSVGIIGGLKRSVPHIDCFNRNLIKTDAAINPGSVGGPLIDRNGMLVGINIAICSSTGGWQGVGYAIPSNEVLGIIEVLKAGQNIERGWLGVVIVPDSESGDAVRITQTAQASPAREAGLQPGDIIVGYAGEPVKSPFELSEIVAATPPGQTIKITILRDEQQHDLQVTLGRRPVAEEMPDDSAISELDTARHQTARELQALREENMLLRQRLNHLESFILHLRTNND